MVLNTLDLNICRTPAFSVDEKLEQIWPLLKAKIETSSPSFYRLIVNVEAHELKDLPEKTQFTIWKYFNRAKYRATPYGNFASYTLVPFIKETADLKIESDMRLHQFIDWSFKNKVSMDLNGAELLFSNTSTYQTDHEIRYLRLNENTFELAAVQSFPELVAILTICKTKIHKTAVYAQMKNEYQLDEKGCKNLIAQMLQLQLLHTEKLANITGIDYFARIRHNPVPMHEQYILAERKLISGGMHTDQCMPITEALTFLAQHLPKQQNIYLSKFKAAFLKKFEQKEVSLAIAMDPELGIGYGDLAQYEQTDELIDSLHHLTHAVDQKTMSYTTMHRFLINKLMESQPIALEEFESTLTKTYPLPNSLSVMCHYYKGNAVIANAGGCTANALLGRFTLSNSILTAYCQKIAKMEQEANPDVIFFDIPYQAEQHIDNVNRRKNCYAHELPILTWSCLEEPLDFNDIMVSIQQDEIILFSKKLGKRLIPRLPSAYNYTRSDLAVYRFLCDLQHQSIQSNLTFDLQQYFPGLMHYPRVNYKEVIIAPAQWLIPRAIYQQKNIPQQEVLNQLSIWLAQKKINFLFKTGIGDQKLCFNPKANIDLMALVNYCKQQGERDIYIEEALISDEDYIKSENGKKYFGEFIINYIHHETIYRAVELRSLSVTHQNQLQHCYLPGSEWLYFEIYVHPSKSNFLLHHIIDHFLKAHKMHINKWFFIRYEENGKHIRLRLQLKDLIKVQSLTAQLSDLLAPFITNGMVNDIAVKSYYREISRYGAARMEMVEQFFCLDSKLVLSLIAKTVHKDLLYYQTLIFLNKIVSSCYPLLDDQLVFAKQMAQNFALEFIINEGGFKKINKSYSVFKQKELMFSEVNTAKLKPLEELASAIFERCTINERAKMLADLIHMHVNRVFGDHQRLHEAILYQFFSKDLQATRSRLGLQEECQASA